MARGGRDESDVLFNWVIQALLGAFDLLTAFPLLLVLAHGNRVCAVAPCPPRRWPSLVWAAAMVLSLGVA